MLIHGIITYVTMQSERNRSHILRCYMLLSSEFLSFNFKNTTHISSTHTRFNPCCFFIDQVPLSCIVLTQFLVYVLYSLLLILMQTHPSGWGGVVDPKNRLSLYQSEFGHSVYSSSSGMCIRIGSPKFKGHSLRSSEVAAGVRSSTCEFVLANHSNYGPISGGSVA